MALMIDKETKEAAPVTAFLNMDKVAKDLAKVNDAARGKCSRSSALRWPCCATTILPVAHPLQDHRHAQEDG